MIKRNYSWPLFLVFLGGIFLLNTTGVIGWDIWIYLIRFWPVLIVIIGINIILGSSILARILEVSCTLALLLLSLSVGYIQYTNEGLSFLPSKFNRWVLEGGSGAFNLARDTVEENFSVLFEEYNQIEERSVTVEMGAASFSLEDTQSIQDYILMNSVYPRSFDNPTLKSDLKGNRLDISVQGASSRSFNFFSNESKYDISVGQTQIPSSFDITLGAGKGQIVLSEILVNDFIAEVGAGSLDVSFNMESVPSGDIRFIVGAGKMVLDLPQRIGYVLEYDLGVGNIKIEGEDISGISGGRGKYTSKNFNSSDMQISMFVTVGVGSLNIESK
jgi:hypothetical protein